MGIGCDWCAYCFDEALLVREGVWAKREMDEAEEQAEHERRIQETSKSAAAAAHGALPGMT
jgi:hypothetical protein